MASVIAAGSRRNEHSCESFLHKFHISSDPGRYYWQTRRHGFKDGVGNTLAKRGKHKQIHGAHQFAVYRNVRRETKQGLLRRLPATSPCILAANFLRQRSQDGIALGLKVPSSSSEESLNQTGIIFYTRHSSDTTYDKGIFREKSLPDRRLKPLPLRG